MIRRIALTSICLAALALGARVDAQQLTLGHGGVGPLAAGNDGVGGIEWHAPTRDPSGGFKQGNGSVYAPPPATKRPPQTPSPLTAGPQRPLARSAADGREGARGAVTLTPFGEAGGATIAALELAGATPGAQVWIAVAGAPSARPLAGGLLGLLPERLIPVGRADAEGKLRIELPAGLNLDGLVLQALVREARWASSPTLQVLAAAD